MYDRNKLGCREPQRACDTVQEFARGDEVAKNLRNGRMVGRAIADISDIRGRPESDLRIREREGRIPVRFTNGRRGEDMVKTIREERPREGCAR